MRKTERFKHFNGGRMVPYSPSSFFGLFAPLPLVLLPPPLFISPPPYSKRNPIKHLQPDSLTQHINREAQAKI